MSDWIGTAGRSAPLMSPDPALRETSVLFATLIGVLMLKERFRFQRLLGAGAVVVGVMALRLA